MKSTGNYHIKITKSLLPATESKSFLIADLCAAVPRLALYEVQDAAAVILQSLEIGISSAEALADQMGTFCQQVLGKMADELYIAFPGPVLNGVVHSERLGLTLSQQVLAEKLKISNVHLVNDLEVMAYGLEKLSADDVAFMNSVTSSGQGNMAILAPGEGLGEAGLFYDGEQHIPFASEGGHSEFSPRTTIEVEFYQYLHTIYGIVSWENVLSFEGLFNIFRFLRDEKRHPVPHSLKVNFSSKREFTKELIRCALEDKELIATITVNTFLEFLAREANSLVLKLKATGGLFLAGEIVILLKNYIDNERFYQKFLISDKMERLLKNTPLSLVHGADLVTLGIQKLITSR